MFENDFESTPTNQNYNHNFENELLISNSNSSSLFQNATQSKRDKHDTLNCLSFFVTSFTSFITVGEYYICIFFIKSMLSIYGTLSNQEAAGYVTGFYALTLFAVLFGNFDAVCTYSSQLMVGGDPRRVNQILRQGVSTSLILLLFVCLPSIYLLPYLLEAFSVEENVIQETVKLTLWMLLPMLFRTIGDSMRGMLQGIGYMKSLGFANLANIFCLFGYSYFLFSHFKGNSLLVYAFVMAIYEFCGLLQCVVFYLFVIDKKLRNTDFPVTKNILWYFYEVFKTISANCVQWMAYEVVLLVVTMTQVQSEIASYSLLASIPAIMAFVTMGCTVEPKNKTNQLLRKNNYQGARAQFWKYSLIFLTIGILFCLPIYFFTDAIFEKMGATKIIVKWINLSSLWLACDCLIQGLQYWPRAMMISLDLKPYLITVNILFGGISRVYLTWELVISQRMGLPGVFFADFVSMVVKVIIQLILIEVFKDSKYEGVLEEKENKVPKKDKTFLFN